MCLPIQLSACEGDRFTGGLVVDDEHVMRVFAFAVRIQSDSAPLHRTVEFAACELEAPNAANAANASIAP
jgi:hypothetical protein